MKLFYFSILQSHLHSFNDLFVSGQQEVHTVVRKLRKSFPLKKNKQPQVKVKDSEKSETLETDKEHNEKDDSDDDFAKEALRRNKQKRKKQIILPTINLDEYVYTAQLSYSYMFF